MWGKHSWGPRRTQGGLGRTRAGLGEGPGGAGWRSNSLALEAEPHAKLLMSLGPWPELKESCVLKMVMRKEGKATSPPALKFLRAYCRLWVGHEKASISHHRQEAFRLRGGHGRGPWAQPLQQILRLLEPGPHLKIIPGF